MVYLKLRRSGPVKVWRGGPKRICPPPDPLPPIGPIYIPIDSSRRQDSEYINLNRFDKCRPKVMLSAAS
jgi:hypothetical protein